MTTPSHDEPGSRWGSACTDQRVVQGGLVGEQQHHYRCGKLIRAPQCSRCSPAVPASVCPAAKCWGKSVSRRGSAASAARGSSQHRSLSRHRYVPDQPDPSVLRELNWTQNSYYKPQSIPWSGIHKNSCVSATGGVGTGERWEDAHSPPTAYLREKYVIILTFTDFFSPAKHYSTTSVSQGRL